MSHFIYCCAEYYYAECRYAECCYTECRGALTADKFFIHVEIRYIFLPRPMPQKHLGRNKLERFSLAGIVALF